MSNTEQDTVGRLAWALRRYALAVVAVVAATAALAVSGPARSLLGRACT